MFFRQLATREATLSYLFGCGSCNVAVAIGMNEFSGDVGAALVGLTAALTGTLESTFGLVAGAMFASGLWVRLMADETLPRLNPASAETNPTAPFGCAADR